MLFSEVHAPEKLASCPPATKINGDIPMDSDAHRIMPRALSPAEGPGCCSDFVYSESRSGSRCYSALVQGKAALGGGQPHPALPCMHARCATLAHASTHARNQSKRTSALWLMGRGHKDG